MRFSASPLARRASFTSAKYDSPLGCENTWRPSNRDARPMAISSLPRPDSP